MNDAELAIPVIGEVVNLEDADSVALAYDRLLDLERQLRDAKGFLRSKLVEHAAAYGGNTMRLDHAEVKVTTSDEIQWNLNVLRELLAAGLPDGRWQELVETTVDVKVKAAVARQIAKANPVYAEIIGRAEKRIQKSPSVSVALRATV